MCQTGSNDEGDPIMTTTMLIDGGWTEATAADVDAAVRTADRAYWDEVAEVFGRRCSANWTEQERLQILRSHRGS
jgi:hypothetical protein